MHRQEQNDKETIEENNKITTFLLFYSEFPQLSVLLGSCLYKPSKMDEVLSMAGTDKKFCQKKNETAPFFVGLDGIGSPANNYIDYTFYSC